MSVDITELTDRAEIQDVLHSYCQAQDQDRWELFDTVFTGDAVVEFPGLPLGSMPAQDLGRFLREEFGSTRISGQHLIANTLYDIQGDRARTVSEVLHLTLQRTGTENMVHRSTGTSLYADTWTRTPDGWRIAHRVTTQKHLDEADIAYDPQLLATIAAGAATDWFATDHSADERALATREERS